MPRISVLRRPAAAAVTGLLLTGAALSLAPAAAQAQTRLPVDYDFAAGALAGFNSPQTPPPGADDFGCRPTSAHPDALDPAHHVPVPCLVVLPITGPVGFVPPL
jgi:triacylglycerol lipase